LDCRDDLVGKMGNELSTLGWKLRIRIAAWRSMGGRGDSIERDVGEECVRSCELSELVKDRIQ
jgi:hypothetical protein